MRFLFVDRILESQPAKMIRGVKQVTQDDAFLTRDEEGRLCFVPSLVGETLGQLAAWNVMAAHDFKMRPVAGMVGLATVIRHAYVGDSIILESHIDRLDESAVQYHGHAMVDGQEIFRLEAALGPMLPMQTFISREEVMRQYAEINRPGEYVAMPKECNQELLFGQHSSYRAAPMTYDRIVGIEPGASITAVKHVTRAAPYFPDHFPHKPVLPLTVLLECNLNLAIDFAKRSGLNAYRTHAVRRVKMSDFIMPGDVIVTRATLKKHEDNELVLQYRTEVNGRRICVLEVILIGASHE